MVFLKIASLIFLFLTPIASGLIVSLFGLRAKGFNFADIAFPMLASEFYLISDKTFYHSLLPHLVLALALLALGLASFLLYKKRNFSYKRFAKLFWRSGFLLTFLMYLGLVILIFTKK